MTKIKFSDGHHGNQRNCPYNGLFLFLCLKIKFTLELCPLPPTTGALNPISQSNKTQHCSIISAALLDHLPLTFSGDLN